MQTPAHIILSDRLPPYREATKRRSMREIRRFLSENGFDEDFAENIDERFCEGFDAARTAMIEILSARYWAARGKHENLENPEEEEKTHET